MQQEFEGWGTSLAWFANIVGRFPDPLRSHLADLLFDAEVHRPPCALTGLRSSALSGAALIVVGRFASSTVAHVAGALTAGACAQVGLGMQICRYNIGGSGWGTTDVKNFRFGANIERCPTTTQSLVQDPHLRFGRQAPMRMG